MGRENTLNTSFILYSIVQFFKVNVHGFFLLSIQFPYESACSLQHQEINKRITTREKVAKQQ